MDGLIELCAMRDRLLQTIGWYTGRVECGSTSVETNEVIQRLLWVLGEEPQRGA